MKNILKPILVILGLVALGAVVYIYMIQKKEVPTLTRTSSSGVSVSATDPRVQVSNQVNVEEFQKLLVELNAIQLNTNVFSKQQYPSLIDHTQNALIKLDERRATAPLGKQNPFQVLDGSVSTVTLQGSPVTPKSAR